MAGKSKSDGVDATDTAPSAPDAPAAPPAPPPAADAPSAPPPAADPPAPPAQDEPSGARTMVLPAAGAPAPKQRRLLALCRIEHPEWGRFERDDELPEEVAAELYEGFQFRSA